MNVYSSIFDLTSLYLYISLLSVSMFTIVFGAKHALHATRSSHEKAVCLSVHQTRNLWQNERNLCPNSYTTWKIIYPSFVTTRMVDGGDPLSLKFWVNWFRWSENADFQSIFARSAAHEKSSKPSPRGGGSKTQNGRFPCKIALRLKKVWYKVSLCENSRRQSCTSYTYPCINDWWGTSPTTRKFGGYWPTPCKTPISNLFSFIEPQP